jgi:hypothetical protein
MLHVSGITETIPSYPALMDGSNLIFGGNAVSRYLSNGNASTVSVSNLLDIEELRLVPLLNALQVDGNKKTGGIYSTL